jgi:hypothetical protein
LQSAARTVLSALLRGFIDPFAKDLRHGCGCSSAVEHDLAKVGVASSILVARSSPLNDLDVIR